MGASIQISREMNRAETTVSRNRRAGYELMLVVLFTGLLAWLMSWMLDTETMPIKHVRIEGKFVHLSPDMLQQRIKGNVKGGFFNIDVTAVRDKLLAEPWVHDVSVHRVWPDSLQVFVNEQIAVAIWNETGLLNKRGEFFSPEKSTFPTGLPVITGPEGHYQQMMEKYYFLQSLFTPFSMHINHLIQDERRAWTIQLDSGLKILLGRRNFETRIKRFTALIPEYFGDKLGNVDSIDMRYPNGFAVKWQSGITSIHDGNGAL